MKEKIFGGKKIKIRNLLKNDLAKARKFQDFMGSLVAENAKISRDKKPSLKEEKKWLEEELKGIKSKTKVFLLAESENKIAGTAGVSLGRGRHNHVGNLGIAIKQGYRGIGLGKFLMAEIIKLAKKELKKKPKIIRLSVYPTNKPAISLYQKFGFKKKAKIPKQIKYKGKLVDEIIMLLYL